MSRFIAILKQTDRGCDYTIGCGLNVTDLGEHEDEKAALVALLASFNETSFYDYHLAPDAERRLESIKIYEVASSHTLDLDRLRQAEETRRVAASEAAREARDRAEYERLRRKFGGA